MDIVGVGATSLHVAATALLLGHYTLVRLVHLPVAERQLRGPSVGPMLEAVERRAIPWLGAALATILATGVYLLVVSPRFTGFGQIGGSSWSVLLLVKHVLVVAMVAIAVAFDMVLLGDLSAADDEARRVVAMRRVRWALDALVLLGAAVIVLTVAAQASA